MRTTLAIVFLFLFVFCVAMFIVINSEPRVPGSQALALALDWTLHLFGALVATAAAIGMLLVAATHGSFQRQVVLALPLLAGLLLLTAHWGLALAFGAIVGIWIFKYGAPEIERPKS
jgi:hypothetical protein